MFVLYCFSLNVLRLVGAAPTMEPSITTEQFPGRRLQIPQIFLHTSDIHLRRKFFSDQPNDAKDDAATTNEVKTINSGLNYQNWNLLWNLNVTAETECTGSREALHM